MNVHGTQRDSAPSITPEELAQGRKLPFLDRALQSSFVSNTIVVVVLIGLWAGYAAWVSNPLMFPSPQATARALWTAMASGELPARLINSLRTLVLGYLAGLALAGIVTTLAVSTRAGNAALRTLSAMFNPLPAIALLPLALLWFGLGMGSLIFVIIHSVLWSVAINTQAGFQSVPTALRMVGRNYGLKGPRYVLLILIPAALPSIISGAKIGWAFAWRTLIAAELVFGVSSGSGGIGWFIFENRTQLRTDYVFAGLAVVTVIGLFVESFLLRTIERMTVQRWGMQS